MVVVDASAVVDSLLSDPPNDPLRTRIRSSSELHAPHLLDVEVTQALRRLVAGGRLSPDRATDTRSDFAMLSVTRYPHGPLLDRAWALKAGLTIYDGMYVALAEILDMPLLTTDARLARTSGHQANVELYARP